MAEHKDIKDKILIILSTDTNNRRIYNLKKKFKIKLPSTEEWKYNTPTI